jgi:2-polyprenyl-3-methyl-5-hydroxy-6-metoxy-1,4-benzoquinol methylase
MVTDKQIADAMVMKRLADDGRDPFVRAFEIPRIRAIHDALRRYSAIESPSVLDIGYLDGRVPLALTMLDPQLDIICTERDEESAGNARRSAEEVVPGIPVDVLDLTHLSDLGGHEGSHDVVIVGEVLEHISVADLPSILSGIRRMLRDEGILIVSTPNLHGLTPRIRHALGVDFLHDPVKHDKMGMGHINLLSARMLCDLARDAGFEVAAVEFHEFTGALRAHRGTSARLWQGVRKATLSRFAVSTRDDLLVVLRRTERVTRPSEVFGRPDASFRASLRAARHITKASRAP